MSGTANGNDEHQICTICVESVVVQSVERSSARLRCGHYFHLDCIGSTFNLLGKMQCPNCRTLEDGEWYYGSAQVFGEQSNALPPIVDEPIHHYGTPVQVFGGQQNIAPPNVDEPQSFDVTAQELHNFMVNGLPEDIPEYVRSRGPRSGDRPRSITLSRVILTPTSSQATGSARAEPNLGQR